MEIGIYLLQMTLCLGLFYGIYMLLLKNEKGFKANRAYLLLTLTGGLIIPLVQIPIEVIIEPITNFSNHNNLIPIDSNNEEIVVLNTTPYQIFLQRLPLILIGVYGLGMLIRLFVFSKNLFSIRQLITSGTRETVDGIIHISNPKINTVFSFMNFIFWGGKPLCELDRKRVLEHEVAHIKQGHSYDIILCEIIKILLWFHPLIYWYKSSLQQVHEYLADEAVIENEGRTSAYATLLVQQAKNYSRVYSICNSLFQQPIKKRLIMMAKSKSALWHSTKMFSVVPVLFGILYGMCVEYQYTTQITGSEMPLSIEEDTEKKLEQEANLILDTEENKKEKTATSEVKFPKNSLTEIILSEDEERIEAKLEELLDKNLSNIEGNPNIGKAVFPVLKHNTIREALHPILIDSIPQVDDEEMKQIIADQPKKTKSGSCYGKCTTPDKFIELQRVFPIYTGNGNDGVKWDTRIILMEESRTEWIKKKDKKCKSENADDCMVWCLEETPAQYKTIKYILDPDNTPSDKFEMQQIPVRERVRKGGKKEWVEIVCLSDMTKDLISKVQTALNKNGASITVDGNFNQQTKETLFELQRKNELPIGNLNLATMRALSIEL